MIAKTKQCKAIRFDDFVSYSTTKALNPSTQAFSCSTVNLSLYSSLSSK